MTRTDFVNKKMYLDIKVWVIMISTVIISLALISYKLIDKEACIPFSISAKSLSDYNNEYYEVGETITFTTSLLGNKEITWEFGDASNKQKVVGLYLRHKFLKDGNFTVSAIVNGTCRSEIRVNIKKSSKAATEDLNVKKPKIFGKTVTLVGRPERYMSDVVGDAYEWKIIDKSSYPSITEQYATLTFDKPGIYKLQLTIDHDRRKSAELEIIVQEGARGGVRIDNLPDLVDEDLSIKAHKARLEKEKAEREKAEKEKAEREKAERERLEKEKAEREKAERERTKEPEIKEEVPAKKIGIRNEQFKSLLEGVVTGQKNVADFDKYLHKGGETKVRENGGKMYKSFSEFCNEIKGKKITISSVELKRDENNTIQQIAVEYKRKRGGFFNKD